MSESDCPPNIRSELAALCRRSRCRSCLFTIAAPTDWRPATVIDPRDDDGRAFSDLTAWDYVAELLENGTVVECVTLKYPPGKKAYVMKIVTNKGIIYIKLQLSKPGVLGRSFHYSVSDYANQS
jgi:hypothetical protein